MVKKIITYIENDKAYIFECPNCDCMVLVMENEVNCQIFRHGIMKDTYMQMNPHAPGYECKALKDGDLIYGCGKPFKLICESDTCNMYFRMTHAITCQFE